MGNASPLSGRIVEAPAARADGELEAVAHSSESATGAVSQDSRKRWGFLGLAVITQISVAIIRVGIPALVPFIKNEFALTYTQVGFISSFLNGGAATAGVPAGKMVDRVGERLVLGYGTIASGALVLGIYYITNFVGILGYLFLIGFITTTLVPAGGKAVAGWFKKNERGMAMGLRQMAVPLGGALAAVTLPSVAVVYGWRFALAAAGILSIAIGGIALRFYQEPAGGAGSSAPRQNSTLKAILNRGGMRSLLIFSAIMAASQWFYLAYLMLYLIEDLKLSIVVGANLLATGQICGAGGRVVWGLVSDRIFNGRRRPALVLVGGIAIFMCLSISLLSSTTPLWLITVCVALLGLSLQGSNGLNHTLASELAGSEMSGLAVGMTNSCGFIGVMSLTPMIGFFIDWSGSYTLGWIGVSLMIFTAVLSLGWIKEENS